MTGVVIGPLPAAGSVCTTRNKMIRNGSEGPCTFMGEPFLIKLPPYW